MGLQVVIAHDLLSGIVLYMKAGGSFSENIHEAATGETGPESDALLALALEAQARQEVLGSELIDVTKDGDKIIPVRLRERIRAFGPTITYGYDAPGQPGRAAE